MITAQQVALVTGASRGIGRAIALRLAQEGYAVVVNYAQRADAAAEVVQRVQQHGGSALAVQGNVALPHDQQRLIDTTLAQWSRLDVLVNNAAITSPGRKDLLEVAPDDWDQVLATNLTGPFFLAQRTAREMIRLQQSGRQAAGSGFIINISSISAYTASTNRADYCIAKAGMQMMTWLFADRLAEHQIGVFEICPGVIASDMTAPVRQKYDRLIADGLTPIRRWGQPEDVANAVAVIVSGGLTFTTGQRIHVDGGFHIRRL